MVTAVLSVCFFLPQNLFFHSHATFTRIKISASSDCLAIPPLWAKGYVATLVQFAIVMICICILFTTNGRLRRQCFMPSCLPPSHLQVEEQVKSNEFLITEAGQRGDSSTPVFSSQCVAIYCGSFKNNTLMFGEALKIHSHMYT